MMLPMMMMVVVVFRSLWDEADPAAVVDAPGELFESPGLVDGGVCSGAAAEDRTG